MVSVWPAVIERVEPLCFRVHAADSLGTAFAIGVSRGDGGRHTMLATALHVIEGVLGNDRPLDIIRSDGTRISECATGPLRIYPVGPPECDSALIQTETTPALVKEEHLCAMPLKTMLARGTAVGWIGYPGFVFPELCFFHGVVSGYQGQPPSYLIDGVAINGVSGGPAFDESGLLVGMVSAYLPNQIDARRTLPGLMMVTPLNLIRYWMQEVHGANVRMRDPIGDNRNQKS